MYLLVQFSFNTDSLQSLQPNDHSRYQVRCDITIKVIIPTYIMHQNTGVGFNSDPIEFRPVGYSANYAQNSTYYSFWCHVEFPLPETGGHFITTPPTDKIWMAVVTPTDRPKSVRYRFGGVFMLSIDCCILCWYKGFRHRTELDLVLYLFGPVVES